MKVLILINNTPYGTEKYYTDVECFFANFIPQDLDRLINNKI